jgi:hypothetical protein
MSSSHDPPYVSRVAIELTDQEFIAAMENLAFPAECFHHAEHLRLAWIYDRESGAAGAAARMADVIRRFAEFHNSAQKFHFTLTHAWVRLVAAARSASPELGIKDLLSEHAELLDQRLPYAYYSEELLNSARARSQWVEPDLKPLP